MSGLSPTIGRLFGIDVELHWSFVLLLLVFMLLSPAYLFFWIVIFLFVLIHELSHSLTAKRYHVKVTKIVLLPIGGMSVMDLDGTKPHDEAVIALAGPMSNIVMGFISLVLLLFLPGATPLHDAVFLILEINLVLGFFNLIPGFPVDGGRILRSYLQQKMDFFRATQIAVKVSEIALVIFITAATAFALLWKGYSPGYREFLIIYDAIIALFLYDGAQAELRSAYIKKNASGIGVGSATSTNFILVDKNTRLPDLYPKMVKAHTYIVLYKDGTSVKAVARLPVNGQFRRSNGDGVGLVKEIGVDIPSVAAGSRLLRAMEKMQHANSGMAAVVKAGKIIGVVTSQHADSVIALHLSNKSHA